MEGYTEVFAWGGDHFGQLGLGGKTTGKTYSSPRFCSFNILIKETVKNTLKSCLEKIQDTSKKLSI